MFVSELFQNTTNITVNASEVVIVRTPTYFTNLTKVFSAANERWRFLVIIVWILPQKHVYIFSIHRYVITLIDKTVLAYIFYHVIVISTALWRTMPNGISSCPIYLHSLLTLCQRLIHSHWWPLDRAQDSATNHAYLQHRPLCLLHLPDLSLITYCHQEQRYCLLSIWNLLSHYYQIVG